MTAPRAPRQAGSASPARGTAAGRRWPLGRIIATGMLALGLVLLAAVVIGPVTLDNLSTDRNQVVDTLDPAALHGAELYSALVDQETGVRGFLLGRQQSYLAPYYTGLADQQAQVRALAPTSQPR